MNQGKPKPIHPLARGLRFPEGPAFALDGSLWCVELNGGSLVRLQNGEATRVTTGGAPNGAAVDRQGRVWFCDAQQNAIRRLDPRSGEIETVVEQVNGQPLDKPNDLAFDGASNLVFTCPGASRQEPTGYVCCRTPDGAVSIIADQLYFPNGLAFVDDGRALVIAETYRQRLWRGAWDGRQGAWREARVWAQATLGAPGPDGLALGGDGLLYVAVFGSGQVQVFGKDGRQVGAHVLPGRNPTNCAFDPAGRLGLVVTEAEQGVLWSLPELGPGYPLFVP